MAARTATATKTREAPQFAQPQGSPPARTAQAVHPLVSFRQVIDKRLSEFKSALPPHIPVERFVRVVITALQNNPKLLACTQQSLWNSCMRAAQDGLLPDGREGAIVPFGDNDAEDEKGGTKRSEIATWMPMVLGLRKKARNSGVLSDWNVQVVQKGDAFDFQLGDDPFIHHKPAMRGGRTRPVIAAYSIATYPDGTKSREVMNIDQIEDVRKKSRAKKGPWADPIFYPEMCRKTVARLHSKQLPSSTDLDTVLRRDDGLYKFDETREDDDTSRKRLAHSVQSAFDAFADDDGPVVDHEADERGGEGSQEPETAGEQTVTETSQATVAAKVAEGNGRPAAGGELPLDHPGGGNGAKAGAWPTDKVPANAAEYGRYVEAKVSAMTDGEAITNWFRSQAERKLRNDCGINEQGFKDLQLIVDRRIGELKALPAEK